MVAAGALAWLYVEPVGRWGEADTRCIAAGTVAAAKVLRDSLEEFEKYLAHFDRTALWTNREWSNTLSSVYVALRVCLREGYDTLAAQPNGFIWYRDDREGARFPDLPESLTLQPNFRELLRIVRRRDPRVREWFRFVGHTDEGAMYRLLRSGDYAPDAVWVEADRKDAEEAPIDLLLGPPSPQSCAPRAAWGLRHLKPAPYDLRTLQSASDSGPELLIQYGVADDLSWVARADHALTLGVELTLTESQTTGWPPDELTERAQVVLEDAQDFVEAGGAARTVPLRLHHREASSVDVNRVFIYLTGPNLGPQDFLLIFQHAYNALIGRQDQLLAASARDVYGTARVAILVVRAGTVMAVLWPGFTGPLFAYNRFTPPIFTVRA